jgi:hypothetical protein
LGYWQRWALTKDSAPRSSHHESQPYKLELGEKLAAFIITKLDDRWSAPITAGVAVIISLFSSLILALVTGRFFPGPGYRALSEDYYYFIAEGLTIVIWFYYIWICKAPFKVIQQLQESATVVPDNTEFNKAKTLLKSQLPTILAGILTLALAFPSFYQMSLTPPIWFNASPYAMVFRLIFVLPTIFAACSATLRLVVNTWFFGLVYLISAWACCHCSDVLHCHSWTLPKISPL